VSNQRFDEAAPSEAKDEAGRGGSEGNASAAKGERGVVKDKPFDEAHDLGDDDLSSEGSVETNDSEPNQPARAASPHASNAATNAAVKSTIGSMAAQPKGGALAAGLPAKAAAPSPSGDDSSSDGSGSSESEDDEAAPGGDEAAKGPLAGAVKGKSSATAAPLPGAYNPNDFKHLPVSSEVKDLFQYIQRYKPHEVELDTQLKCFIPDFIPAVGEMDAFIKVPMPDNTKDSLGLQVLDEPSAQQSDATVLELQLRAASKQAHGDLNIRSIENAAKNPAEVERWIKSITDLHKQKPSVEVQYKRNMPDLDSLMQEWPGDFEEALRSSSLPSPNMDLSVEDYAKVLCALMDVPVYDSVIESLHVVFSLYSAFKENPHFAARSKENDMMAGGGGGGGPREVDGIVGAVGRMEGFGDAQVFSLDESKN